MKFSIDAADWKSATEHIKRALVKNPARPILEYAKYEFDGVASLRIIAVNDNVLNTANIPAHCEEPGEPIDFVAPIPVLWKTGNIDIEVRENHVLFSNDKNAITVSREADLHPDWTKIIPKNREVLHYFNTTKLRQAIDGLPKDTIVGINFANAQEHAYLQIGVKGFYSLIAPCYVTENENFDIEP